MSTFTFLHAADLHLDTPFRNVSDDQNLRTILKNASLDAFSALVDLAIRKSVDAIIIAGDLYDGEEVGLRAQFHFLNTLKRASAAGISSYVLLGNHDPQSPIEEGPSKRTSKGGFSSISSWPENVHFFSRESVQEYPMIKDGNVLGYVLGQSFPGTASVSSRDILQGFREFSRRDVFTIGVYHGHVTSSYSNNLSVEDNEASVNLKTGKIQSRYAECSLSDLVSVSSIDYWALGHLHALDVLRDKNPSVVYPGTIQGRSLKPSERGEKGVVIGQVRNSTLVDLEFVPLAGVEFHELKISSGDVKDFNSEIKNQLDESDTTSELQSNENSLEKSLAEIIFTISEEMKKRLKKSTEDENAVSPVFCVRLILSLQAHIAPLFSDYRTREDFSSTLAEILLPDNIYLLESRFETENILNSKLHEEILTVCTDSLSSYDESEKDLWLKEIFSEERKLSYAGSSFDSKELEENALKRIQLSLSSMSFLHR